MLCVVEVSGIFVTQGDGTRWVGSCEVEIVVRVMVRAMSRMWGRGRFGYVRYLLVEV